jgi:hypothetical protein
VSSGLVSKVRQTCCRHADEGPFSVLILGRGPRRRGRGRRHLATPQAEVKHAHRVHERRVVGAAGGRDCRGVDGRHAGAPRAPASIVDHAGDGTGNPTTGAPMDPQSAYKGRLLGGVSTRGRLVDASLQDL